MLIVRHMKQKGAAAIEYALIAGLIAIASIVGMQFLGVRVDTTLNTVATSLPAM